MADINVKIIHPTNCSDVDIELSENIVLRDVFSELINANFLSVGRSGESYRGVLRPSGARKENVPLDNDKTIAENGVGNNDTIQIWIDYTYW